jgi:putative oxidoreductase
MTGAGVLAQLGWALVRVVFGAMLAVQHGYPKVFDGKVKTLMGVVAKMGLPRPEVLAWCAALGELVGGTFFALGLLTRPAAAWAAGVLSVALYFHRHDPVAKMELAALFFVVMVAGVLIGGGTFSLDTLFRRPGDGAGGGARRR